MQTTDAAGPELDLEAVAEQIARRGLAVPAIMFLELHRPLGNIASQALLAGWPIVAPFLGLRRFEQLREVLADPARYRAFIEQIESKASESE